jgi:hypothetical protein
MTGEVISLPDIDVRIGDSVGATAVRALKTTTALLIAATAISSSNQSHTNSQETTPVIETSVWPYLYRSHVDYSVVQPHRLARTQDPAM